MIAPSNDFKKHFRENMFDKPNTAGFIHISHYLLTIYDIHRFEKLIEWPVICKKTEAKYRNGVKDYLSVISAENPDIDFPPILASYLLHAGGTKFTIIMWKLSQVVLRTYIRREGKCNIINAPKLGVTENLSKTFLNIAIAKSKSNILRHHSNLLNMDEMARLALIEENDALTKIKADVFETHQSITNIVADAPVDPSNKKRLLNINDTDIIHVWKNNVLENIKYIQNKHKILKDLNSLSSKAGAIILNIINETKALSVNQLERIDLSVVSELSFPPNIQCLLYHLYTDDRLVIFKLILVFSLLISQLYQKLRRSNLKYLSECLLQVEASCTDMKSVCTLYRNVLEYLTEKLTEAQNNLCQKNWMQLYNDNMLYVMDTICNVVYVPSPLIKIDTNYNNDKSDFQKRLELTPVESSHKSLFLRYERHDENHTPCSSKLRRNVLLSRINVDDTISSINVEKSPHAQHIMPNPSWTRTKQTGKYSRLFSLCMKKNNRKANCSAMSIPCSTKANSTVMASAIEEMHNTSDFNLNAAAKNLFNLSTETIMPEKLSPIKVDKMPEAFENSENSCVVIETRSKISEIDELTEIEFVNTCEKNLVVKTEGNQNKRRSISDLVERYKKLLEVSNCTTANSGVNCLEQNDEQY
ncbi:hypothetical protein KM043_004335 [Ampulex compressa]|nr:hypothetical protein KM043_004335 [Ampulex compressa]